MTTLHVYDAFFVFISTYPPAGNKLNCWTPLPVYAPGLLTFCPSVGGIYFKRILEAIKPPTAIYMRGRHLNRRSTGPEGTKYYI